MHDLNQLNAWKSLNDHYNEIKNISLNKLFKDDTNRFNNFSVNFNNMLIDYSKNHINKKTLSLFKNLLTEININQIEFALHNDNEYLKKLYLIYQGNYNKAEPSTIVKLSELSRLKNKEVYKVNFE